MKSIVIIGYGQLGFALNKSLLTENAHVLTLSRTPYPSLAARHHHQVIDLDSLTSPISLPPKIDCLYYLAPPSDTELSDKRLANFLKLHKYHDITHIIYISTSGVYGNSHGEWLTETSPTLAQADRARRRLNAEQQLLAFHQQTNTSITILRCAAIYSEKTVNYKRIKENTKPVIAAKDAPFTNRIHLQDLTEVCWQALQNQPTSTEIFNVSDGHPSTTTEHAWLLSDLAGVPRNKEIALSEADQYYSPAYMSYLMESKKLDTSKLIKTLKPNLNFENCEEGIKDCLKRSVN